MIDKMRKHTYTRRLFWGLSIFLMALIYARYAFKLDIPRIVLSMVIVWIALCVKRNDVIAVAILCLPVHNAVSFFVAVAACAVIFVVRNYNRIRLGWTFCLIIFAIMWELLHYINFNTSLTIVLAIIAPLVFLLVILSIDVRDIDYTFVVRALAFFSGCIGILHLIICIVQADFNIVYAIVNLKRLGMVSGNETLEGLAINPNSLGIINVLGITGLLQLTSVHKQKKIDYWLVLLLVVLGVLTASRTFLVCLVIMGVLLIMGQSGGIKRKLRFFLNIIVAVIIILLIMSILFPGKLDFYIKRFTEVSDITNGRNDIMEAYSAYIQENLDVFFWGIGASTLLSGEVSVVNTTPHNCIQEIIVSWGVFGLCIVSALISALVIESRKYSKRMTILNFIPLLIILIKSMAGQLLTSNYTMIALAFAYLSLCQDFSPQNNAEQLN